MEQINLVCATCNKAFKKYKNEYNRRIRDGATRFFCGMSCTGIAGNKSPKHRRVPPPPKFGKADTMPFRWFLARARYRKNRGSHDLTLEYLRDLWGRQKGQCPLTGWNLDLPHNTAGWSIHSKSLKRASLDRIDNSLGYVQGNVRFIATIANYARNTYSDADLIEFCQAVAACAGERPCKPS